MTFHRTALCACLAAGFAAAHGGALAGASAAPAPVSPAHLLVPAVGQAASRDFGVIIDTRRGGVAGATVLAVTPGSMAERFGLRAGDVLVSVDGQPVLDASSPASALRQALEKQGQAQRLDVLRSGEPVTLRARDGGGSIASRADRDTKTAAAGCGYVAIDGALPRNTHSIYPVEVVNIDGVSTPVLFTPPRHRVDAGQHVLILRERIDDRLFGSLTLTERERLLTRMKSHAYKVLVVDVPPGKSLHLGARLITTLPDIAAIRANSYWEPVVWNVVDSRCP